MRGLEAIEGRRYAVADQWPQDSGTFSRSRSAFESSYPHTAAAAIAFHDETYQEHMLEVWKGVVTRLVTDIFRQCIESYVERYFETAEESDSYLYHPETITASSLERVRRIRGTKFEAPEKIVSYTEAELKNFF